MALADTVGAAATIVNLPAGATTTTLESKTNFFAAGRSGVVRACTTFQSKNTDAARGRCSLSV